MKATLFIVQALLPLLVARTVAQQPRLAIQPNGAGTLQLSIPKLSQSAHTFIEFSTKGVWYPAYYSSSNAIKPLFYTVPNAGGARLFRASQATNLAVLVKQSWQRLGVTNYVFQFSKVCICAGWSVPP